MNRRGRLEAAVSRARMPASAYALYTQLLRRAGNDTGEINDDKWAPTLPRLARQAKIHPATAYLRLRELIENGWFLRYATDDRAKIAGHLMPGRDFGPDGPTTACQRCGDPLGAKRADARYCSDRCRKRARRSRTTPDKSQVGGDSVRGNANGAAETVSTRNSPDNVRDSSRTVREASPDKSQVSGDMTKRSAVRGSEAEIPACCKCRARPAGLGGILCLECKTTIETRNRRPA